MINVILASIVALIMTIICSLTVIQWYFVFFVMYVTFSLNDLVNIMKEIRNAQ